MMSFWRNKWVWIATLGIAGMFAVGLLTGHTRSLSGTVGTLGVVQRGDLVTRVTIAGTIIPNKRTTIMAPFNGYVQKLHVRVGDKIQKGDPLVAISTSILATEPTPPLRSAFTGVVTQVLKAEGEYVHENDIKDPILRVDDLSHLFIEASAPEIDVVKVHVGQEAVVKATAIVDRSYQGLVREISLASKEREKYGFSQQVEFPVRVEVINPDNQLKPGMSVILDIVSAKRENVLVLGHEFVDHEGARFYVTLSDGTRRDIEVGLQNEESFEIKTGVSEGARVRPVDFMNMHSPDQP